MVYRTDLPFSQGGGGYAPGQIVSLVEPFSINIDNSALTNTATITGAVAGGSTILVFNGTTGNRGTNDVAECMATVTLTNPTTVTAARGSQDTTTDLTASGFAINLIPGVVRSIQYGTAAIASGQNTSPTTSINAVSLSNSFIVYLGTRTTNITVGSSGVKTYAEFSGNTGVVAKRNNTSAVDCTVGFVVVELVDSIAKKIQLASYQQTAGTATNGTMPLSIPVNTAKTIMFSAGYANTQSINSSGHWRWSFNSDRELGCVRIGNTSTTDTIRVYCVELNDIYVSNIQAGVNSITAGNASAPSAIASSAANKTFVVQNGSNIDTSVTIADTALGRVVLTDPTTVTGLRVGTAGALTQNFQTVTMT